MTELKRRRDEYAEATRKAIVEAALELFSLRGYAHTSLDDVAEAARVSKGAIYHHFANKQAVFEAVLVQVDAAFVAQIVAAIAGRSGGWDVLSRALNAYLDASVDPVFCRLALQEGPIALGWERWRQIGQENIFGHFADLMKRHCADAFVMEASTELVLRTLVGALHEMALSISGSTDPQRAKEEARTLITELVASLRSARTARPAEVPGASAG